MVSEIAYCRCCLPRKTLAADGYHKRTSGDEGSWRELPQTSANSPREKPQLLDVRYLHSALRRRIVSGQKVEQGCIRDYDGAQLPRPEPIALYERTSDHATASEYRDEISPATVGAALAIDGEKSARRPCQRVITRHMHWHEL